MGVLSSIHPIGDNLESSPKPEGGTIDMLILSESISYILATMLTSLAAANLLSVKLADLELSMNEYVSELQARSIKCFASKNSVWAVSQNQALRFAVKTQLNTTVAFIIIHLHTILKIKVKTAKYKHL